MPFIDPAEAVALRSKVSSDKSQLGKIFVAKSSKFHTRNIEHSLVESMLADGWKEQARLAVILR